MNNIFERLMREICISRTQAFNHTAQASSENWKYNEQNSTSINDTIRDNLKTSDKVDAINDILDQLIIDQLGV